MLQKIVLMQYNNEMQFKHKGSKDANVSNR